MCVNGFAVGGAIYLRVSGDDFAPDHLGGVLVLPLDEQCSTAL